MHTYRQRTSVRRESEKEKRRGNDQNLASIRQTTHTYIKTDLLNVVKSKTRVCMETQRTVLVNVREIHSLNP